jgi:hypothetical protein
MSRTFKQLCRAAARLSVTRGVECPAADERRRPAPLGHKTLLRPIVRLRDLGPQRATRIQGRERTCFKRLKL